MWLFKAMNAHSWCGCTLGLLRTALRALLFCLVIGCFLAMLRLRGWCRCHGVPGHFCPCSPAVDDNGHYFYSFLSKNPDVPRVPGAMCGWGSIAPGKYGACSFRQYLDTTVLKMLKKYATTWSYLDFCASPVSSTFCISPGR